MDAPHRRKLAVLVLGVVGLAGALTAVALLAPDRMVEAAATYVPTDPARVLEHVPPRDPAEVRARAELAAAPERVELAVALAEADVERGRRFDDPRALGDAETTLAKWRSLPDPPPGVRLVRARLAALRHEWDAARRDLEELAARRPEDTQVQLALAVAALERGDEAAARASCEQLGDVPAIITATCLAPIDGLADPVRAAERVSAALAAAGATADPGVRAWATSALAALAVQRGEYDAATSLYAEVLAADPDDHAARGALADVELAQGSAAEASALLEGREAIDSLLVRRALAEHAVRGPDDAKLAQTVHDRIGGSIVRGDLRLAVEMARCALALDGEPKRGVALARAAWRREQDLPGARVLADAAAAAHDADAVAPVRAWQTAHHVVDAQLARALAAGAPPVRALGLLITLVLALAPRTAHAHKPSDAQLHLTVDGARVIGRLDVALRDLDAALGLDTDGDGAITWAEVTAAQPRIAAYIAARLALSTDAGPCPRTASPPALVDLSDGTYWAQPFTAVCPGGRPDALTIRYALLFDLDAQHQALVHVDDGGATAQTLLIRDAHPVTATLGAATSLAAFVRAGVFHIWSGLDHILFLLCLVLPAVYVRRAPAESLRGVVLDVFEVVTAFTLAHSITLAIAAVGLVRLPSRFVETAIALSVFAAAANNLVRAIDARWAVAFALGLLHGFGFASGLVDLGLPSHELASALLGFNLGVELGQAAIVLVAVPVLFALRRTLVYQALLWGGSGAVALVALVWAYQRAHLGHF